MRNGTSREQLCPRLVMTLAAAWGAAGELHHDRPRLPPATQTDSRLARAATTEQDIMNDSETTPPFKGSGGADAQNREGPEPRPDVLRVVPEHIPVVLCERPQWVCWRLELRKGNWTKPPLNAKTGGMASATDPATWTTFPEALAWHQSHPDTTDGIGFMFSPDDPFAGIDLDDCLDEETWGIKGWALPFVDQLNTYTEISPSGTGLKSWCRGKKKGNRCKKAYEDGEIEMYDKERFFTVTGRRYEETPAEVNEAQEAFDTIYAKVFEANTASDLEQFDEAFKPHMVCTATGGPFTSDEALLEKAMAAKNGDKFRRLWTGDRSGYKSHSEADSGLCYLLAFWTAKDRERMDRLFRASALMSDKWDTSRGDTTYGWFTIDKAIANCRHTYGDKRQASSGTNQNTNGAAGHQANGSAGPSANGQGKAQSNDPKANSVADYEFNPITSAEFDKTDYRTSWLVMQVMAKLEAGVLGGPKKALKTSLAIDLACSLGSGTPFLGQFAVPRPVRVAVLSGESGPASLQRTARLVCQSKSISLKDIDVLWGFKLPQLSNSTHMDCLRKGLETHKIELLQIDPIYLCILSGADGQKLDPSNLFDMGPLFANVAEACLSVGCTPQLLHHAKKTRNSQNGPLDLDDLSFAGIAEFARQWMLLSRREAFEPETGIHKLGLEIGGSAGHSSSWALDIDQGVLQDDFSGRKWGVALKPAMEFRTKEKETKVDAKEEKSRETVKRNGTRILQALDKLAPNGEAFMKSKVSACAGLNAGYMEQALLVLTHPSDGTAPILRTLMIDSVIGSGAIRKVEAIQRIPTGQPEEANLWDHSDHSDNLHCLNGLNGSTPPTGPFGQENPP